MSKHMAHKDAPLCILANNRPVWEDDLNVTTAERIGQVIACIVVAVVLLGFVLLMSLAQ
jgi:hypothetical protein